MNSPGTYGERLGAKFRTLVTRSLCKTDIAVTEVRADCPTPFMTGALPSEDAFSVALTLRDYRDRQLWEDGREAPRTDLRVGDTIIYDFKRNPVGLINKPIHAVHFYLSRATLNAIADDANAAHIGDLARTPGFGIRDVTVGSLARCLLPALERPEQANRMFVDHVTRALAVHVAQTYGGMQSLGRQARGGLAPWQERRAKEILSANLEGNLRLQSIAQEVGLSASHLSRAFRKSTGIAPHQWLLQRRVEAAKALLKDRRLSLSEVALSVGFADQSHFTRVFSGIVGVTPGLWRRYLDE